MHWIFTDCCNLQHHQAVNSVTTFTYIYIVTFLNNKKQSCISYNPVYGIEGPSFSETRAGRLGCCFKELINVTLTTTNHPTGLKLPDRDAASILSWDEWTNIVHLPQIHKMAVSQSGEIDSSIVQKKWYAGALWIWAQFMDAMLFSLQTWYPPCPFWRSWQFPNAVISRLSPMGQGSRVYHGW